jgi:hypothetical protein
MKPSQTPLNKAPSKGENGGRKREDPSPRPKGQTPKWITKGAKEQIMFRSKRPPSIDLTYMGLMWAKLDRHKNLNT